MRVPLTTPVVGARKEGVSASLGWIGDIFSTGSAGGGVGFVDVVRFTPIFLGSGVIASIAVKVLGIHSLLVVVGGSGTSSSSSAWTSSMTTPKGTDGRLMSLMSRADDWTL